MRLKRRQLVRLLWRWFDPNEPHPQAVRRLRAVVMASTATLGVSGLVSTVTSAPADHVAGDSDRTTTSVSTAAQQPLVPAALTPVVTRVETTDPVVFVTIDDGFTRAPEMTALVDELDIPLTFFLVDQAIHGGESFFRSFPDAAVEAHTRSHLNLRSLPEDMQRDEICGNADTIVRAFGRRPLLFRPPEGSYDVATQRAAAACGMAAIVLWEEVVEDGEIQFRTVRELRPGDIVLLHFRPGLPQDLQMLVRQLENAGLKVGRLEDYLPPSPLSTERGISRGSRDQVSSIAGAGSDVIGGLPVSDHSP